MVPVATAVKEGGLVGALVEGDVRATDGAPVGADVVVVVVVLLLGPAQHKFSKLELRTVMAQLPLMAMTLTKRAAWVQLSGAKAPLTTLSGFMREQDPHRLGGAATPVH